ncbi:Bug family tripartite tricarboxylate transporter substrate binding protein [Achromobacter spanius]|uniref:Bug family tripartite tricarboxylate transporter substrate binding protein n=1 Tax=Achromobacter spanius TaxID=217203 RepID=UPI0036E07DD9
MFKKILGRSPITVVLALLALTVFLTTPPAAHANDDGVLKIVVPFPAGSATDSLGRMLAVELEQELGRSIVIENKPGASGLVGAMTVKNAASDGKTVLLTTNTTQAANASLFAALPYDPVKDFAPIGQLGASGMMLMVRSESTITDVEGLLSSLKGTDKSGKYGHGSAAGQVAAALFVQRTGLNAIAVPYKGVPPAIVDLIGGRLDFAFVDLSSASANIASGRLRGLAVALPSRSPREPEIPTLTELGVTGVEVPGWFGLVAPAGTSEKEVNRLATALQKALARKALQEKMLGIGIAPTYKNPAEFSAMIKTEVERWREWVVAAGITPM